MEQIKIFEGNGNNEKEINEWMKENPNFKIVSTNMVPMFDKSTSDGDICNQWVATIIVYCDNGDISKREAIKYIKTLLLNCWGNHDVTCDSDIWKDDDTFINIANRYGVTKVNIFEGIDEVLKQSYEYLLLPIEMRNEDN